jgi:hypothetical protein
MNDASLGDLLYRNPLASPEDLIGFQVEGEVASSFPRGRWRLEGIRDPSEGQASNLVVWCPQAFPDHIHISWQFQPLVEPGLSILFFAARGRQGQSVLDPTLSKRSGPYEQYHHGDLDALHVSYFRRKHAQERAFTVCNLRKSHGFHLVAQGADPLPSVADAKQSYRMWLIKSGPYVRFGIDALECFHWCDPGDAFGPVLGGGHIGFRQMTPLVAEYADLVVHALRKPLEK